MLAFSILIALLVICSAIASSVKTNERRSSKSLFQETRKTLFGHFMSSSAVKKVTKYFDIANRYETLTASQISELMAPYKASSVAASDNVDLAGRVRVSPGYLNIGFFDGSEDCTAGMKEVISIKMGVCHKIDCGDSCGVEQEYSSYMVVGGDPQGKKAAYVLQSATEDCDFGEGAGGFFGSGGISIVIAFDKAICSTDSELRSLAYSVDSTPRNLPGQWAIEKGFSTAAECSDSDSKKSEPVYTYATIAGHCSSNARNSADDITDSILTTCNGNVATRSYYDLEDCIGQIGSSVTHAFDDMCSTPTYHDLGMYFTNFKHRSIVCETDYAPSPKANPKAKSGKKSGVKRAAAAAAPRA